MSDARFDLNGRGPFYAYLNVYRTGQNWDENWTSFHVHLAVECASNGWGTYGANGGWQIDAPDYHPRGGLSLDFRPAGSSARRIDLFHGDWRLYHDGNGYLYDFNVSCWVDTDHDSIGDGGGSVYEERAPRIPKPPLKPPTGYVSNITPTSIRLNGSIPDDRGAGIDYWEFAATGTDGAPQVIRQHNGHILDVGGLIPGKGYRMQYRAHNSRGWSEWSDNIYTRTLSGAYRWNGSLWMPEQVLNTVRFEDSSVGWPYSDQPGTGQALVMTRNADNTAWQNAA